LFLFLLKAECWLEACFLIECMAVITISACFMTEDGMKDTSSSSSFELLKMMILGEESQAN
jgi:hypothetical protein